jgi:hypothetical protein
MLSDSQGSTETSETHGWQKQYVGRGFLVRGAGSSLILNTLFEALRAHEEQGAANDVAKLVEGFFEREVRADALGQIEILHVPEGLGRKWSIVAKFYKEEVLPFVEGIRDARRNAYRACSRILAEEPGPPIEEYLGVLADSVPVLEAQLATYLGMYDGFAGRPAL